MEPTTKPSARSSAHQWRQIIKQQHKSSLRQKAFCQSRNIDLSTFDAWKHKLGKIAESLIDQLQPEASPDWIELPSDSQETTASASWHIELELPGESVVKGPEKKGTTKRTKSTKSTKKSFSFVAFVLFVVQGFYAFCDTPGRGCRKSL